MSANLLSGSNVVQILQQAPLNMKTSFLQRKPDIYLTESNFSCPCLLNMSIFAGAWSKSKYH